MPISWGKVIAAAVPAVVQAGAGLFQNEANQDIAEDQLDQQLEAQRERTHLELRLAALKAQYQGGGGGGGANPNVLTAKDKAAIIGDQGDRNQSAINNLITAIQNGYALRGG